MKLGFLAGAISLAAILALAGCEEKDCCGAGGTFVATGGSGGGGSDGGGGGVGGASIMCMECACFFASGDTPSGCADTCDNTLSGTPSPNFCNGAPALSQCAQCILDRCGETPNNCL